MTQLTFAIERDELNERLGGGLPGGSLVVVDGQYGAGKSILTQRLAYGLVKNGASVAYVSTEVTTAGLLGQMESLAYDLTREVLEERFVFIPLHPILGHRSPRQDGLRRLLLARRMYAKDVVLIDTFSKFLADHERMYGSGPRSMEMIEAVLHLFKRLTSLGKTIVLTFEVGHVNPAVATLFREAADMGLSLQFELLGNTASRRIVVNRLSRARRRYGDVIGYRVEPGVGIVIEIKSVV